MSALPLLSCPVTPSRGNNLFHALTGSPIIHDLPQLVNFPEFFTFRKDFPFFRHAPCGMLTAERRQGHGAAYTGISLPVSRHYGDH